MTKTELLADLATKPWVDFVGTPEVVDSDNFDGSVLYRVGVRQIAGIAGGLMLSDFYVVDEGQSGEFAFWKDSPPYPRSRPSAMKEWFVGQKDLYPQYNLGTAIIWVSERWEEVVYAKLDEVTFLPMYFYLQKADPTNPHQITGTTAEVELFIAQLRGSLFQV